MESSPSEADTGSAKLQGLKWLCRCVSGPPTPSSEYPHLDPILTGAIKAHRITSAWDEVVRLVASMSSRVVSPSLVVLRLGSYARQNRIHQALAEIGRIHKTVHILRTLDNEEYRRRMGRELNKGEASRGREFGDQLHTFSCLSVLHNAVVAWNMVHIEPVVEQLRAEGQRCDDELLSLTTPLLRRHLNPFGRYYFDLVRMRQDGGQLVELPSEASASEPVGP
jgi:Tn3 transposase DDE domain